MPDESKGRVPLKSNLSVFILGLCTGVYSSMKTQQVIETKPKQEQRQMLSKDTCTYYK
jgi:hypothetical protein